jgi:hypothetical protein
MPFGFRGGDYTVHVEFGDQTKLTVNGRIQAISDPNMFVSFASQEEIDKFLKALETAQNQSSSN